MKTTSADIPDTPPADRPRITDVLALDPVAENVFRNADPTLTVTGGSRLFGGQVAAQAFMAAGLTVPRDRPVHSLHCHFLRSGFAGLPVDYRVQEFRDGGSFSTRRVVAEQSDAAIFTLTASFQTEEEGFRHQVPRSAATDPDLLPPALDAMTAAGDPSLTWYRKMTEKMPVEMRFDGELPRVAVSRGERPGPRQRFWLRSADPLGDDPLPHAGAVTFATDLLLLSSALPPHGMVVGSRDLLFASLDHTIWFHRPFRADTWFHYDQESSWADRGRALCRGLIYDQDGALVATVMQEALIRSRDTARRAAGR